MIEAETVRLVFRLFAEGDDGSGPMGVKSIASWLNEHGHRTRSGGLCGLGRVHALLTNPVYSGRQRFNRKDSKTNRLKAEAEHVYCDAPPIVSLATFDAVQRTLKSRNPKVTPPRIVSGPILLTGLATCATCGGGMTMRAGTSRSGEVYRYYSCNTGLPLGHSAPKNSPRSHIGHSERPLGPCFRASAGMVRGDVCDQSGRCRGLESASVGS